ncbi:MAG: SDR family NAD(P)-dependent oxidoreductase [Chloroflexi bacterium]|nr:SDR family NAD(P)-dependent oxidoreductase [Chloroflexota bacterium]
MALRPAAPFQVSLSGQTALVTGAGEGVGRAAALALARAGAAVLVNDLNPDRADTVAEAITAAGGRAFAWQADVTNRFQVSAMIERARDEFGRIDLLINAAGVYKAGGLDKLDEWEWERILNVNMTGRVLPDAAPQPRHERRRRRRDRQCGGGGGASQHYPARRGLRRQQIRLDRFHQADRPRTRAARHPRQCGVPGQPRRRRRPPSGNGIGTPGHGGRSRQRDPLPVLRRRQLPHRAGAQCGRRRIYPLDNKKSRSQ